MSGKKKKKRKPYKDIELNIMPFIDVFSLLNTFLLMSAVFLSIGVLEVQIPFLTSAPPDTKDTERSLDVKIDMTKDGVEVITSWSKPPVNEEKKTFKVTKEDLTALHRHLVEVRRSSPETDKVSFYTDDDVIWKDMAAVLDQVKLRQLSDPIFAGKDATDTEKALASEFLFPKVVMSSVML